MSNQAQHQLGDGNDNLGHAVSQISKVGNRNASALTGSKLPQIAAKGLAGGTSGAVAMAVWESRHTLYRVLICMCLFVTFMVVLLVSLPSIVSTKVFGFDGTPPEEGIDLMTSFTELSDAVSEIVEAGYDHSISKVESIIMNGGYDYDLSMEALVDYAKSSSGYDVSYILAAYSVSMEQLDTDKTDMLLKLSGVSSSMFPVTSLEKRQEIVIPVTYFTYKAELVTEVVGVIETGSSVRYELDTNTYFLPDESFTSETEVTVDRYKEVKLTVPVYENDTIIGTEEMIYYATDGRERLIPERKYVEYIECTIHPFDDSVIIDAFDLDLNAEYGMFHVTNSEAIDTMAKALKMTLYGALGTGQAVPLTDTELVAFVSRQNCSATRKEILSTALSLVGKVPYFWGGKSGPGWNEEWNTPKLVTSAGSTSTGTIRPYGLDCSGFTDWTYQTAIDVGLNGGTYMQWEQTEAITEDELLPGDLGFLENDNGVGWNHVLIFAGYDESGERMWVHSSSGSGVILNRPSYENSLLLRRVKDVDFDSLVTETPNGEPLYTLEVDVTHYCACSICCGEYADGYVASGKLASRGMVAMSSYYPFGTQIQINGTMYTVEDRGGTGIENNIHRVDIFVPDHNEALRLGRYTATASVYRLGR